MFGNEFLEVHILVDSNLKLTRVLDLVGSKEIRHIQTTVRSHSQAVIVVAALEDDVSLGLVPLLVVGLVNRDAVVVSVRPEEALSSD